MSKQSTRTRNEMAYKRLMANAALQRDSRLPTDAQLEFANTELHSFIGFAKLSTDASFWLAADISVLMTMAAAFLSPNVCWFYSVASTPCAETQALRVLSAVIDPTEAAARFTSAKIVAPDPSRHTTKEVATHVKSQIARCFWTGAPIDDRHWQTDFTVQKLFPIDGLDDAQNLVVVSRTAAALISHKNRVFVSADQPIKLTAVDEEVAYPSFLEYGILKLGNWLGSEGSDSYRTHHARDMSSFSVNLNGSRVCPRASSRTRIAFTYLFLRDKYPSLASELDQYIPFGTLSQWLTGKITGADVCWQVVLFHLQNDIVPWFQVDADQRQQIIKSMWNAHELYVDDDSKTPFATKTDQSTASRKAEVISCFDAKIYCVQLTNPVRTKIVGIHQPMSEECTAAIARYNRKQLTEANANAK